MPVTKIRSRWDSGNLIFHESSSLATIADVLKLSTTMVTVGSATNVVDFKVFMGSAAAYALFDCDAAHVYFTGLSCTLDGDLDVEVGDISLVDDQDMEFGDSTDALIRWSTGDSDNESLVIALGDSNQGLHITDKGAVATDWNIAATTNPTLYIHSNGTPASNYLMLGDHDGTTAYIDVVGGTTLSIDIAGTPEVCITANAIYPATDVGNALGITNTNEWANLYLGDTGVIGWNNSNCAITHAAGILTVTGDISASNAAGPSIQDEAATTTVPTLIPNKADLTTGIGWNTTELHFVVNGVDEVQVTADILAPGVTNSCALGSTSYYWSDLFLALEGVINFNNDVTITHAANTLAFAGATSGYTFDDTVTSSDTTTGFDASGAATTGFLVSGACTNGINITSTGTTFGLLYDADMTTQIGANVEGIKVMLERTADVTVATGSFIGAEFIIKKGDTGWSNKPATNVYGVRIAMDGSCTDASGSVMGLRCETQGDGYVDYVGYFSVNSGGTLNSGVVSVNAFENAPLGIAIACSSSAVMTSGILFTDVNAGGTITNLLHVEDGANTTNFLKSTLAEGCIAATGSGGATRSHRIACDIAGVTYYLSLYTD